MAEVFMCAKGQLNARSRKELREAGIVVVEVEDPTACQFIRSSEIIGADDMLWACLSALAVEGEYGDKGVQQREALAKLLFHIANEARSQRKAPQPPLD